MQKQVTPAMIVVALIVLVIIIGALWYFTMGRQKAASTEEGPGEANPIVTEPPEAGAPGAQSAQPEATTPAEGQ